jgi:hypothetical protein
MARKRRVARRAVPVGPGGSRGAGALTRGRRPATDPPPALDYENTAKDLQQIVKTKKTELLFLALFLRLLKPGGRA